MSPQVNLSIKEIYDKLCPKCKKKIEDLVMEKITREQVKRALDNKG